MTLSAIDLTRLESFNQDLAELFDYIKNSATDSIFVSSRNTVQTFPEDNIRLPRPTDDYIDLYDFLLKTKSIASGRYSSALQAFDSLILANRSVGSYYPQAKGLAAWFPDNYLRFKERAPLYQNLLFPDTTGWAEFLNQYYHSDDVKPPIDSLRISKVGSRNNFTIYWNAVYDLAGVTYQLTEIADDQEALNEKADSLNRWDTASFSLSINHSFSPRHHSFLVTATILIVGWNLKSQLHFHRADFYRSMLITILKKISRMENSKEISAMSKSPMTHSGTKSIRYTEYRIPGMNTVIYWTVHILIAAFDFFIKPTVRFTLSMAESIWMIFKLSNSVIAARLSLIIRILLSIFSMSRKIFINTSLCPKMVLAIKVWSVNFPRWNRLSGMLSLIPNLTLSLPKLAVTSIVIIRPMKNQKFIFIL